MTTIVFHIIEHYWNVIFLLHACTCIGRGGKYSWSHENEVRIHICQKKTQKKPNVLQNFMSRFFWPINVLQSFMSRFSWPANVLESVMSSFSQPANVQENVMSRFFQATNVL